jgi:cysteine synthase A|tara:strand:- start:31 stop:984 length:954 start_codon:yes stop_codon:yes gene_type:complete
MIYDTILDTIGKTPVVKVNKVANNLDCEVYAKCEFFNPGGSIKDRIGFRMVIDAQKSGRIKPGETLIEPTSGNTGQGIALASAVLGYKCIITMPKKMSKEKQIALEALGAEIIRTPTEAAFDDPESHIQVAKKLQKKIPNSHILDQYSNPSNPKAHYEGTAEEIIEDFGKDLDMVVMGVGTGGTITGVAQRLKEFNSDIQIIGADPVGSILGGGNKVSSYLVEGIGYDFFPDVLDNNLIDQYIKTEDEESFKMSRKLIKEEGLLCGGSCGSAMVAALKAARNLTKDQKVLVVLPDSIRNYMTKFPNDSWMVENGFEI